MVTDYVGQAQAVADRIGLRVSIEPGAKVKCPDWVSPREYKGHCIRCGRTHGNHYLITLSRVANPKQTMTFDFWGSWADANPGLAGGPKHPTIYDILACVSSDMNGPIDADSVVEEYGPMLPSHAEKIAAFTRKLQRFFTIEEQDALGEIQ